MLLHKNISTYIQNKIIGQSYSDKKYVQYILELITLENYIRTWKVDIYFQGFTIDFLRDTYFDEYLEITKEIHWEEHMKAIQNTHTKKENHISRWIDFSHSWELEKGGDIWIELWGKK